MRKRKSDFFLYGLLVSLVAISSATALSLSAFIKVTQANEGFYASVGLRSYFHCGIGTKEDPFVITRPRHLDNRARLQSLGIFSEKKYFELGYDLKGDGNKYVYTSDSSNAITQVLDRKDNNGFVTIGNESVPFYGEFEGNNLEIANLTVHASPEDSGRFGYVASEGKVRDFALDNVTILSDGYAPSFDFLYGEDAWKNGKGSFAITAGKDGINSRNSFTDSYDDYRIALDKDYRPVFSFTAPSTVKEGVSYSLLYSDVFASVSSDGKTAQILSGSQQYNPINYFITEEEKLEKEGTRADARTAVTTLSLVASVKDDSGISHSKVINALDVAFQKKTGDKENNPVYRYVRNHQEAHGNNIGLVIGHLDGSCQNVYVHDGSLNRNGINEYRQRENHSTHGLIGLVGATVDDHALSDAGGDSGSIGKDVGVLDYTNIYNSVVPSSASFTKDSDKGNWYIYSPIEDNPYEEYLRYFSTATGKTYYASKENSIDLIGKNIIQDEPGKNRGLGVFTIGTDYSGKWVDEFRTQNAGVPLISKRIASAKEEDNKYVYYSTAEVTNFNDDNGLFRSVSFDGGNTYPNKNGDAQTFVPGYFLPTDTSSDSRKDNEKHFNYRFRFQLNESQNGFYFSNVDSSTIGGKYLSNYFNYKLIDKNGKAIPIGNRKCGVRIKNKSGGNIASLSANRRLVSTASPQSESAYRPSNYNERFVIPDTKGSKPSETDYTVANTINFKIDSENGANVTIVASNREPNSSQRKRRGSVLGVYKLPDSLKQSSSDSRYYVPNGIDWGNPSYGRLLPSTDRIEYYDVSKDGVVGTYVQDGTKTKRKEATVLNRLKAVNEGAEGNNGVHLIAHTFKLPKGRYCLGSFYGDCSVYYVCAQGQNDGDITLTSNVTSQVNRIDNIDFLKESFSSTNLLGYSLTYNDDGTRTIPDEKTLKDYRCFILFNPNDPSVFTAKRRNLSRKYQDDAFLIQTSDKSALTNLSVLNYGHRRTNGESGYYSNVQVRIKDSSSVLIQGKGNQLDYRCS